MGKRKTFHNPDEQAAEAEQRALKRLIQAGGGLASAADIRQMKADWQRLEAKSRA